LLPALDAINALTSSVMELLVMLADAMPPDVLVVGLQKTFIFPEILLPSTVA
jgi:hypothetical protein